NQPDESVEDESANDEFYSKIDYSSQYNRNYGPDPSRTLENIEEEQSNCFEFHLTRSNNLMMYSSRRRGTGRERNNRRGNYFSRIVRKSALRLPSRWVWCFGGPSQWMSLIPILFALH